MSVASAAASADLPSSILLRGTSPRSFSELSRATSLRAASARVVA
jgi:hypothetical protein